MRSRRRRSHHRRQDGLFFQPGAGLQLSNDSQIGSQSQDDSSTSTVGQQQSGNSTTSQSITGTSGSQDSTSVTSGSRGSSTGPLQTQIQSVSSSSQQPSSAGTNIDVLSISMILLAPSSLRDIVSIPTSLPSSLSSSPTQSSESSTGQTTSTTSLAFSSGTASSSSASVTTSSASSRSSSTVSPSSGVDAAGHSTEFYVGIIFIAIVALACLLSFAAWMLRSQRNKPSWCGAGGEDDDIENQDTGLGLGLYLEKSLDGVDTPKDSSTSLPEAVHNVPRTNPFVLPFTGFTSSPGRYPQVATRPPAATLRPADTAQSPSQLLGPLHVKNYMPGDFSSSCDEAVRPASSRLGDSDLGTPRETHPGAAPRFLGLGGQGLSVPWAPLNVKSARAPSQVSIAHSLSQKSVTVQTEGEDEITPLPMPHFSDTLAQSGESAGGTDSWGATLRFSLMNALTGLTGSPAKPLEDRFTALPASRSHSSRWRSALSSRKDSSVEMTHSSLNSTCDARTSPKAIDNELTFVQPGLPSYSPFAHGLSFGAQGGCNRASNIESTAPLSVKKKSTKTQSRLSAQCTNAGSASRASSVYSPSPSTRRRLGACASKASKTSSKRRSALSRPSLARPPFLRRVTGGSATSFSSEASETPRDLTDEELLAKRMMMLRARRKRGMGSVSQTGSGLRLTTSGVPSRQLSSAMPSRINSKRLDA